MDGSQLLSIEKLPEQQATTFSERSRWPPLTRMLMSGEVSGEPLRELNLKEKFDRWYVQIIMSCFNKTCFDHWLIYTQDGK